MSTINKEELKELIAMHNKWLNDNSKGKKLELVNTDLKGADLKGADLKGADLKGADLRYADLTDVDLRYADLKGADLSYTNLKGADLKGADLSNIIFRYCIGNGKEIKSLQIGTYVIAYTKDILNIGCQSHTLDKWKAFSDNEINNMDSKALEWWKLNKDIIITLVSREVN
jgi:hypothetical protein